MKKIVFLILTVFTLSCSSDNTVQNATDTTQLQRVDFFPGSPYERRWLFNSEGLLSEITKANGTVVQDFIYDDNNKLISSTVFNDNGTNQNYSFTYDNNGFVATVNGETVNYDATQNVYYLGDLSGYHTTIKLNEQKLLTERKVAYMDYDSDLGSFEVIIDEMNVVYQNDNIVYYSPNESCASLTYNNSTNPLRNATLAICRAFSFVGTQWTNGIYNSTNNVVTQNYCLEDPESYVYNYNFNSNNLPVTQTRDNYYSGVYENTITSTKYYYEGDVLP